MLVMTLTQTSKQLNEAEIEANHMQQKILFKAQLFIPYKVGLPKFRLLNKDCINGFYIHYSEIKQLRDCKFYIPTKVDWLLEMQTQVNWLNFLAFSSQLTPIIKQKTSPLCWVKYPNGTVKKFFVVWWE